MPRSTAPHVTHLAKLLTYITHRNASVNDEFNTVFHSTEEENEPLVDFITRLDDNIRCSEVCYATALVYIDRITELSSDLTLNIWTVQRLFSTALLIANQFLDDTSERALQFARVTGTHPYTMSNLKTEFLFRVQFRLHVSSEEISNYSDKLQGRFSTAEFKRLEQWDGTQPRAPVKSAPKASAITAEPPKASIVSAPRPTIPNTQNPVSARSANSTRVSSQGAAVKSASVKNSRHIRHRSAQLHSEMVSGLTLGIESIFV